MLLVAISVGWIPLIQQMQGGQLYIYIQAVASYLSPPIAMVYCLAISWPRMNEMVREKSPKRNISFSVFQGAFYSLMYGLTVGLFRMLLDFLFPEPMCMELDDRPSIVKHVHYMYFAAGLFITTGVVAIIISLYTSPPRDYMVCYLKNH